ncbi:MAG: DNA-processing protein DprA [Candidatus Berkiella sp.]
MPGLGPRRFAALHQQEESLSNCFSGERPTKAFVKWCELSGLQIKLDWQGVARDLAWQGANQHIITWDCPSYPPLLKEIHAAPFVLFVKGDLNALHLSQIALVGSRKPSPQGKENASHFASALAAAGLVVTSGLALGIDAASHEGALAAGGTTIAVLGNGLDQLYPRAHKQLAERIASSGALVSEFPLGTLPLPSHFPQRNRIISGLSKGVLVIEAAIKSGSLVTANYALEQGREIFALPGSIHNPMAKGCNHLIRQGAKCVESVQHILEELSLKVTTNEKRKLTKVELEKGELISHIDEVCTSIDSIVMNSGLTAQEVSSMLLELELKGAVVAVPGGYVRVATGG